MTEMPEKSRTPDRPAFNQAALPLWRRLLRRVENVVFGLLVVLIFLYFVLQLPVVQNWLADKTAGYLSKELDTEVSIRHIGFSFFDNLDLDGLYIEDLNGDTLLYAGRLSASLNSNLFSIFRNDLEFNEISLKKARFNLRRAPFESHTNLQFLLDYFIKPKKKPKKDPAPFALSIKRLYLTDVEFLQDDLARGRRTLFGIPSGSIRLDQLETPENIVKIRSVSLDGFACVIAEYARQMPPEDSTAAPVPVDTSARKPRRPLLFSIDRLSLANGRFVFDKFNKSLAKETPESVMDYNHLNFFGIDLQADSLAFTDDLVFRGKLRNLSVKEQCGFDLLHSEAERFVVNDTIAALYNMRMKTAKSELGDTLAFRYGEYRDFFNFNNRVRMDIRLRPGSKVRLGDIMYFSAPVDRNSFFVSNRETVADIAGLIEGKVNRLNGRNLKISIGTNTVMEGDFDGEDMARSTDLMRLQFDFKKLQSDYQSIRKIIPGFRATEQFERLGRITFKGNYQIIFGYNHVLDGQIDTDVGAGNVNMALDMTKGREKATYSGSLDMKRFDLAAWTGNSGFGDAKFNIKIDDGSGLTLASIRAKVSGIVDSLFYQGYNYRNIGMNGRFDKKMFDGNLAIRDPNVDFEFDGNVDFKDSLPQLDFKALITRFDLGALNLLDRDWVLSGKVEQMKLNARDINNLTGSVFLRNFQILQDREKVHRIDSLQFTSGYRPDGTQSFALKSTFLDAYLNGRYTLTKVPRGLIDLFSKYHPELARRMGLPAADTIVLDDNFDLSVSIKDTRQLTHLWDEKLDTLRDVYLRGHVESGLGISQFLLEAPEIRYGGIVLKHSSMSWYGQRDSGTYNLRLPEIVLSKKHRLAPITLAGFLTEDDLSFSLDAKDSSYIVENVSLKGDLTLVDSLWQVRFNSSKIALFNEFWYLADDNFIRFGKNYFSTRNFYLSSQDRRIVLDERNAGKGLSLALTNFDLRFANRFMNGSNFQVRGKVYDCDFWIDDLFQMQGLHFSVNTDTVFVKNISEKKEKSYGELTGNFDMTDLDAPVTGMCFFNAAGQQLSLAGAYLPGGETAKEVEKFGAIKPKEFQTQINATRYPLDIIESFIPGISKTEGLFNASVNIGGPLSAPGPSGVVNILNGRFRMDYLNTMFYLRDENLQLTHNQLWADKDTIFDESRKNFAIIHGGLLHNHLKDWRVKCRIESANDRFLVLNTTEEENSTYYGRAYGKFDARFDGTFSRTDIDIVAATGKDTKLYIPLSAATDTQSVGFIKLYSKTKQAPATTKKKNVDPSELKGLNFVLNLTVTREAEVQMIFDEQAGDIIKGVGDGNIRLVINREGEFLMYGDYTIRKGDYNFTLLNLINKPFAVKQGGTIHWYGDPYGAQINLDATYEENTSLYNLLREELQLLEGSSSTKGVTQEARKATRVVVTMHLKGDLMKPAISFDLDLPVLNNTIKNVAENKLRLLKQDQSELTRQVFGLIVIGSFLPQNTGFIQSSDYVTSVANTLTQVLSNQLSNYLSGLATEWFGGAVSSIDFDIAYSQYQNALADPSQPNVGRELQLRLTSGFINDRVTIQVGSQFGLGQVPGVTAQDGFLGEDVTLELQLTENQQWRLRVYQRTEPDFGSSGRRQRYGFGLSFRREYDSFTDMMQGIGQWFKRKS
jgi:TamB, inner membrane protein subunit of TAM complex